MSKIYLLNNQKYEGVENIEVFKIEYISKDIDLSRFDALVFTSKNAVYSLDSFNKQWKDIPSYAIASKTANIIKEQGGMVEFVANSSTGDEFAVKLLELLKNKKVLYLRAEKVVSNLFSILKSGNIDIDELTIYKTVCNDDISSKIEDDSTIIFTSPSSVKCFFKKFTWNKTLKAITIGETTAMYLPSNVSYKVSSKTSIEECINLAKQDTF